VDHNPLDVSLLGYLKPLVYLELFGNEKTLHQNIFEMKWSCPYFRLNPCILLEVLSKNTEASVDSQYRD
jgi:hypothetical protein